MTWDEEFKKAVIEYVPFHMQDGVFNYVYKGIPGGSFFSKLLMNDFVGVVGQADHINEHRLHDWAMFLYNHMPSTAWKTIEKVNAWIESGGIDGQRKEKADE